LLKISKHPQLWLSLQHGCKTPQHGTPPGQSLGHIETSLPLHDGGPVLGDDEQVPPSLQYMFMLLQFRQLPPPTPQLSAYSPVVQWPASS
jgi:hypothetical protein